MSGVGAGVKLRLSNEALSQKAVPVPQCNSLLLVSAPCRWQRRPDCAALSALLLSTPEGPEVYKSYEVIRQVRWDIR